jgi:DNA-directed RNA polymerase, mitochondrial
MRRWTTPLGLPVMQPYLSTSKLSVNALGVTVLDDSKAAPDLVKQATAFPPNYIHSLDAAHMMLTARACRDAGIAFAGVHDSYWTHAADVDTCRHLLREQFVDLYSRPLLDNLHADLLTELRRVDAGGCGSTRHCIAPPPAQGTLDLRRVLASKYFFN